MFSLFCPVEPAVCLKRIIISRINVFLKNYYNIICIIIYIIIWIITLGFTGLCSPDGSLVCYLVGTYLFSPVLYQLYLIYYYRIICQVESYLSAFRIIFIKRKENFWFIIFISGNLQ